MREADLMHKISDKPVESTVVETADPLYGKHIVMTKIRDAGIMAHVERVGGIMDNAIGKKTNILITKSMEDVSVKTKYALEHNSPIFTPETFRMKYFA